MVLPEENTHGFQVVGLAKQLAKEVKVVLIPELRSSLASAKACAAIATDYDVILLPSTRQGTELASVIAGILKSGIATNCTALTKELVASRQVYVGRAEQKVKPITAKKVFTITSNVAEETKSSVEKLKVVEDSRIKIVKREKSKAKVTLLNADVVVSAGRGMIAKQNLKILEKIATQLGGAVGCTQAVVQDGWYGHEKQIGLTGKNVAPKVYLAFGISGAIQHVIGMKQSHTVIAINTDEEAPIMKVSDYSIIGDASEVASELLRYLKAE